MLVDKCGEVAGGSQHAGADARNRHESHHQPVNHQQAACHRRLAAHPGVHHHNRREEIAQRDALQNPCDPQLVEVEIQKAVIHKPQAKQNHQPADQVRIKLGPVGARLQSFGNGKGQHHADDEEEHGENQIIETEARPGHVFELRAEPVAKGTRIQLAETVDDFLTAGDPKHVEAAKRVDGSDAVRSWCQSARLPYSSVCPQMGTHEIIISGGRMSVEG